MVLGRLRRDGQPFGDLWIGEPVGKARQHISLARRQHIQGCGCLLARRNRRTQLAQYACGRLSLGRLRCTVERKRGFGGDRSRCRLVATLHVGKLELQRGGEEWILTSIDRGSHRLDVANRLRLFAARCTNPGASERRKH